MKNDRNKNVIIALLVVIIIILGGLLVLFATGKINLKSNDIDTNNNENIQNTEINDVKNEESLMTGYYQEISQVTSDSYVIREFKLNNDNTVNYIIGGSNNENHTNAGIVMNYSGTYLEKDNKIILSIMSTDSNCEDGKYPCIDIITLTKQNDDTLVGSDSLTETYNKVENLLLIK